MTVINVWNFMTALEMRRHNGIKAKLGVASDQHLLSHAHVTRARSQRIDQGRRTISLSIGPGAIDQANRFVKMVRSTTDDFVRAEATAVTNSLLQFQQRLSSWASCVATSRIASAVQLRTNKNDSQD
ncbi:hypothetical protein CT676_42155 [Bradyrhizobium sp. MOS001]|uniref:hypothetical protein n=1 Tax=Bradyrhizobium sp. MOS001 TaxID=2133948 RepID=UPI001074F5AC|nr:hypothetical protein [Bradyrhizobium sp. MOS001]TFW52581.1 hypothetical protein CT676_42155 [Bradyrhizobium sp. MOS001]